MTSAGAACTLALDLGTTAFKAAAVTPAGVCGGVTVVPYSLEYEAGRRVTCDPRVYVRCAFRALRGAVRSARAADLEVTNIGIASQAQTFVPVGADTVPVAPAIVWTDASASAEAEEAGRSLPDYGERSGFVRPSPLQFLPKVMRYSREGASADRFLLLNEWIVYNLTGACYGDTCLQGMGGFYDIARGNWNDDALQLAGISTDRLAPTFPAAAHSLPLTREATRSLGLKDGVPVYSCGNDQSCAAIGAGLSSDDKLFANFGTALVVYALTDRPSSPTSDDHIAGVSPLRPWWFRLGVESECGNMLEWLATLLYPRKGIGRMLEDALSEETDTRMLPDAIPAGGGSLDLRGLRVGMGPPELTRALLERYSVRFADLLDGVVQTRPRRVVAGGGLSRCRAWLRFLSNRHGLEVTAAEVEHPGLVGVARVIGDQQ